MAASLWSAVLGLGVYPAARMCHRAPVLHALRLSRPLSARYASSAVKIDHHTLPDSLPPSPSNVPTSSNPNADQPKFDSLQDVLSPLTLRALTGEPFNLVHMSPVQAVVLPLLPQLARPYTSETWEGPRDLMVKARTGTGKTLGFLVPAVEARLNMIQAHVEQVSKDFMKDNIKDNKVVLARAIRKFANTNVGALIISPTRELATQIANEAIKLTKHHGFEVRLFTGGVSKMKQVREWDNGRRDIVVATPGRLRDLIENEYGFADALKTTPLFILDEADTLLEMGFLPDITAISQLLEPPPERQTFMFSATMAKKIREVARDTLSKDHKFIDCVPVDAAPTHLAIPQYYTALPDVQEHLPHILRLIAEDQLSNPAKSKVLIFLPTTKLVKLYSTLLNHLGKSVLPAGDRTRFVEMHSKKAMESRVKTSDWFRKDVSGASVMITSDVSARGVDYPGVTRVIQIGSPASGDSYVHRVGRTGRGSNMTGRADLVLFPWETGFVSGELADVPIRELSTTELKEQVDKLAQEYNENPSAFFPDTRRKRDHSREVRTAFVLHSFQPKVPERLEEFQNALEELRAVLSKEDVNDAMATILAFYMSNATHIQPKAAVIGVQEWAEAIVGEKVHLRIPREFLQPGRSRTRQPRAAVDYKRSQSSRQPRWEQDEGGFGSKSRSRSRRDGQDGGFDWDRDFGGRSDRKPRRSSDDEGTGWKSDRRSRRSSDEGAGWTHDRRSRRSSDEGTGWKNDSRSRRSSDEGSGAQWVDKPRRTPREW